MSWIINLKKKGGEGKMNKAYAILKQDDDISLQDISSIVDVEQIARGPWVPQALLMNGVEFIKLNEIFGIKVVWHDKDPEELIRRAFFIIKRGPEFNIGGMIDLTYEQALDVINSYGGPSDMLIFTEDELEFLKQDLYEVSRLELPPLIDRVEIIEKKETVN